MSGRQLAAEMQVSPAAIVSLCDRLERDGYLRRVPDSIDRRVTWFELTAAGDRLLDEILNVGPARIAARLSVLTPEERQLLVQVLDKLGGLSCHRRADAGHLARRVPARAAAQGEPGRSRAQLHRANVRS